MLHGIFTITAEEGFRCGIYKGIEASLAREATYSSLRLGLYEPIKLIIGGGTAPDKTPGWHKFAAGALSGIFGQALANPTDLIKTKMQASAPGVSKPVSWYIIDVYKQRGVMGFYYGVQTSVTRAMFLNATYLGTYDTGKHYFIDNGYMEDGKSC